MARRSNRRAKGRNDFKRQPPSKSERDKVLIVSEGEKTEPSYFEALRKELGLTTAKVRVTGEGGSAPTSVVDYAESILKKDDDFEQIYFVFDRDGMPHRGSYNQALARIAGLGGRKGFKGKTVEAITSVPCFEVWYLLHVQANTPPYEDAAGGASPAKALISDLKRAKLGEDALFAEYEKSGCEAFYDAIAHQRSEAKRRAARILQQAEARGDPEHQTNPSTRVHLVVAALEKLSKD